MTLSNKPNESNRIFTWFAMVALVVFCISKTPIVTWVGSQELLIKLTTVANVSYPLRDIQRSKEVVHVIQEVRVGKTCHFSLVFVIIFGRTSFTICLWDGNWTRPHWQKTKYLSHGFSTNDKGWYFLAMYNIKFSKKIVYAKFNFA